MPVLYLALSARCALSIDPSAKVEESIASSANAPDLICVNAIISLFVLCIIRIQCFIASW